MTAADVAAFVAARLDDDEYACATRAPDRRYADPVWGLQLVSVLRSVLAGETGLYEMRNPALGLSVADEGGMVTVLSPAGREIDTLSAEEFRDRYMQPCPPSEELLKLAAVWADHPDYRPEWKP